MFQPPNLAKQRLDSALTKPDSGTRSMSSLHVELRAVGGRKTPPSLTADLPLNP